jgi:hypothetical protein
VSGGRISGRTEWSPERLAALSKGLVLIIIGGIAFGIFAVYANLYYVGAIVAGLSVTILVAWKFESALLVYALVAFVPWGRTPDLATGGSGEGKGVFVSEVLLGFLLAIWLIKYFTRSLPKDRIRSGFHVPIALYIIYSGLCLVNGFIFWDPHVDKMYQFRSVNMIEFGFRLLCAGGFFVMATSVTDAKWLKRIAVIVLVPGLYNMLNSLIGGGIPLAAPWWPLLMLLPASYFWAIAIEPRSGRLKRAIGFAVIGLAVFVILARNITWVSGWLGLGTSLAAVTFVKSRKLFLVGLLALFIVVIAYKPFFYQNVIVESKTVGDFDRFDLMRGAWKYAMTFPLGVGPGNYRSYNSFYYGQKWGTTAYTSAHGTYSQHLSEMGVPGFILLLAILISGARWLHRRYRAMPDGFSKTFVIATIGQLVGIGFAAFIGDYIIPTYHNNGLMNFSTTIYSWLIWGLAVAAIRIEQAKGESPAVVRAEIREEPLVPALATTRIYGRRT